MSKLVPKYTMREAVNAALVGVQRALEEIRTLARTPGPAGKDGVDGKDGAPGTDGKDGIGFDDVTAEFEDEGRVDVMRFWSAGRVVKQIRRKTKMMLYRGVFDVLKTYEPGDVVTWNGSSWHCHTEIKGKCGSDHFTLIVKKGRDGKD